MVTGITAYKRRMLSIFVYFLVSVAAGLVVWLIGKWLDKE